MEQPRTMADVLNMTPESKKALERKINRQIITFVTVKVAITVGTIVAIRALGRQLDKLDAANTK